MRNGVQSEILLHLLSLIGVLAEWLGRGLQNLLQRFESARRLKKPSSDLEGFFNLMDLFSPGFLYSFQRSQGIGLEIPIALQTRE